ncbi:uncharacterized protein Bfra_005816, partial [Botrytis fragariae]
TLLLCEQPTFVKDQTDQVILAANRLKNAVSFILFASSIFIPFLPVADHVHKQVSIFHYSRVFANTNSSCWPLSSSKRQQNSAGTILVKTPDEINSGGL